MSIEQQFDGGEGVESFVDDHDPQGECDSRIFVNGTRIPVVSADVYARKEGALDVTRYAEVQFPAVYQNEYYRELFSTVDPDLQNGFDTLYIELKNGSGSFVPVFRGFVTGVGATDQAPIWECRARGPADLLTSAMAGKQFTGGTVKDPINYVASQLENKLPFDISVSIDGADTSTEIDDPTEITARSQRSGQTVGEDELSSKTFQTNRHTLKDVVDWVRSKTGYRLWFEPTETGASLLVFDNPTARSFKAHYLGGNVDVISNNALSELSPINTIEARGSATKSQLDLGFFELNTGSDKYIVAKARHKALYERASNTELQADTFIKSDGNTTEEVKNDARSALKDAIDEATAGDMKVLLAGGVTPFDTIEARPTCRTEAEKTVPITYEVNRVHHMVSPDDNDGFSKSRLNVGIHTDINEDIEIVQSYKQKKNKES